MSGNATILNEMINADRNSCHYRHTVKACAMELQEGASGEVWNALNHVIRCPNSASMAGLEKLVDVAYNAILDDVESGVDG